MPLKEIARLWLAAVAIVMLIGAAAGYSRSVPTAQSVTVYQDPT